MSTKYKGTPQEELALNTFIKLTRATAAFQSRLGLHNSIEDLTVSQFSVLEALYHLGPMCQNEIGGRLLMSGGNMTMVIDNLEKRDLVRRERSSEDRRRIIVSLTNAGTEKISRIFPLHVYAIQEEMSVLSAQEQETLGTLCRKLGLKESSPAD